MNARELALLARAAEREGLTTRREALRCLSSVTIHRRVKEKVWKQLHPGVFAVTGTPPTRRQQLLAVQLSLEDGFAFSHATAAGLHGLWSYENEGPLSVTIGRRLKRRAGLKKVCRVRRLRPEELAMVDGFPVTSVTRTLVDLAPSVKFAEKLRRLVNDALSRKLTTLDQLEAMLTRLDPRSRSPLWALINEYRGLNAPTESELERRALALLQKHGLKPVVQHVVMVDGRCRRIDLFFADWNVMLETDGYLTHSSPEAFEADRQRQNALVARGITPVRWTWKGLLEDPEGLIRQLKAVLISKGARFS